ncbi:MAG: restriction endonuclease subunit S [Holdemanella sp.]|nr:restriction endonuclease subunit S [Holdemanella sp.]
MKFLLIYVPNLRFSFEEDWCTSTIGENFRLSSGLTPSTKEKAYFNNGIIPWINSGELKNKYISFTENKLTLDAVKKHNLTIYPMDTMVIAIYGLEAAGVRGKASITKMDSTISQSCMAFNSLGNVLTQFMYYVYKKEAQILGTRYAQGTKQQNLSSDLLSSYKLLYPSKEEQLKIVNFLSLIDEKIETQSKIINDCMSYRNAIVDYFFESLSSDWKQVRLSNILNEYSELHIKDNSIVHATLSKNGIFPKTDRYDRDFLVKDEDKKYKVTHLDDICYNPANLKFGVITRNTFGDCIISPIYITFTIKNNCLPKFVELLVTRKHFIAKARKYEQGTVYERMSVNSSDLLSMYVLIPTLFIQQKIVNIIDIIDNKISNEQKLLNLYKTQKDYLLKNMFV